MVAGALLLPLILAYFMMHKKLCAMKTAVKEDYAGNYMKPNSMNLDFSRDIFLYSTVTKTEKPKSDSGSHTSSSGRSCTAKRRQLLIKNFKEKNYGTW